MDFRDQDFAGQNITLDGNTFTGCTFRDCIVVYRGSGPVHLGGNRFKENVRFVFEGAAASTIQMLASMYSGGFRELVDQTIANIRGNTNPRFDP